MVEAIEGMPKGSIGYRVTGDLEGKDYTDVIAPAIEAEFAAGRPLRFLLEVGPGFDEMEAGAMLEDLRHAYDFGVRHHSDWRRCAVATDVTWIVRATGLFGWMAPGEVRVFGVAELEVAKSWVAG